MHLIPYMVTLYLFTACEHMKIYMSFHLGSLCCQETFDPPNTQGFDDNIYHVKTQESTLVFNLSHYVTKKHLTTLIHWVYMITYITPQLMTSMIDGIRIVNYGPIQGSFTSGLSHSNFSLIVFFSVSTSLHFRNDFIRICCQPSHGRCSPSAVFNSLYFSTQSCRTIASPKTTKNYDFLSSMSLPFCQSFQVYCQYQNFCTYVNLAAKVYSVMLLLKEH